jgi:hypothetical protein
MLAGLVNLSNEKKYLVTLILPVAIETLSVY